MKWLTRLMLGVAIALTATVTMAPASAYAAHEHVTLAPGGSSQTTINTPSSGTVTNSSSNGTATFNTQGNRGTAGNPPSGSSGGSSTPPGSTPPNQPPSVTCTSNCSNLVYYTPAGPPPPVCWWTPYGSPGVSNGVYLPKGQTQGYSVACTPTCPQVTGDTSGPCSMPPIPFGCKSAIDNPLEMYCSVVPPGTVPGYHTSWTIGVPGDGGTVCVTAWRVKFQNSLQTFTDGGNCYTSPPTINFKYTCNVQPTYSVYARVTAPGGGSVTVSAHYSSGGYTYTLPSLSFPPVILALYGKSRIPSIR